MESIGIKVINRSGYELPAYATVGSAGVDVRAVLEAPLMLRPLERAVVKTGLYFEIPFGYEGQLRVRSGLAARQGLTVLNAPGTIDSDYRGEVGIILCNVSNAPQEVQPGERVAQIVFAPAARARFEEVQSLDVTVRGEGGFGSTGLK